MNKNEFKSALDIELNNLELSESCKHRIKNNSMKTKNKYNFKLGITLLTTLVMCVTTVYAGYYIKNKIQVNDEILPELDQMKVVNVNEIDGILDKETNFFIEKEYSSYENIEKDLGISLLKSNLATSSTYFKSQLLTSIDKSLLNIQIENYILGDISKFIYLEDMDHYNTEPGEEYHSTINLEIDIVPTDQALESDSGEDYLGMYKFKESYTSKTGYKVNIIESTGDSPSILSEKSAIFVADGIRYTLKGRVSTQLLKNIVDSMSY